MHKYSTQYLILEFDTDDRYGLKYISDKQWKIDIEFPESLNTYNEILKYMEIQMNRTFFIPSRNE